MTRLRQMTIAGLAAIAIGATAGSAFAEEIGSFQNRLNGATIGLPLGAAPPPGIYTGLETAYIDINGGGRSNGQWCVAGAGGACANLPAIAQAVPLLWVPGWTFFGANYSASLVQAFYIFTTCGGGPGGTGNCSGAAPITGGGFVYTNTFIQPISLSWKLGGGWFVSTGFAFTPPDGTRSTGTPNPDYWTLEPQFAISYLGNNWVASANLFYDFNTRSNGTCCAGVQMTNGDLFYGDFTVLYKFGKWSVGPVAYVEAQTTNDTGCPVNSSTVPCGRYLTAAAGGLVGYDFGPVDMQVWVTGQFAQHDSALGNGNVTVWSRIGFKLWGPEPPKPLVAKN